MTNNFKKQVIKGSLSTLIGTIVSMFCYVFSITILTRFMMKDDLGTYVLILVVVNSINILSGFGLNMTLVKFISGADHIKNKLEILRTTLQIRFIILIGFSLLFFIFNKQVLNLFGEKLNNYLLYIVILYFLASFRDLFYNLYQGYCIFKKYAIVQISCAVFRISLIFTALLIHQLSLKTLIHIEVSIYLLCLLLLIILFPEKKMSCKIFNPIIAKQIVHFSLPLYLAEIITFILDQVNILIVGAYLTASDIAYFDIADKIPQAMRRMFNAFIIVFFPNISRLFSEGKKEEARAFMNEVLIIFSTGISFFILVSYLFKEDIIKLAFSEKYINSSTAFFLMMVAFYFRVITNILGRTIVGAGYSSVPVKSNSVSVTIGIVCSILLIPKVGFIGGVYSILIMNIISNIIHYIYSVRLQIYSNMKGYLKPIYLIVLLIGLYIIMQQNTFLIKLILIFLFIISGWIYIKELRKYVYLVIAKLHPK